MNIFDLRDQVLADYRNYVSSFLNISDSRINDFVTRGLGSGAFWPESLIQLNPSFEMGGTVGDLVEHELLDPLCERIFQKNGAPFKLFNHQERAIRLALERKHYILTTGTGSGKSLTYIIPIIDHILKNDPGPEKVRALIVYPMNALINSQENAIKELLSNLGEGNSPIRFARYTGQENNQRREELREHPPHILLTNYVMLELMMSRPKERVFLDHTLANLEFLTLDELHTYTGRQGADVSLLVRRVRRRCGNPDLLCIGTSATMVSGGSIDRQRQTVAETASKIFGVHIPAEQVIDEKLKPSLFTSSIPTQDELRQAVLAPTPTFLSDFVKSPLASWIETTYGIESDSGHLRRRIPIALGQGAQELSHITGIDKEICMSAIRGMLQEGAVLRHEDGTPVFAIRLHQFISKCESVYASLEPPDKRYLTLSGQRYAKTSDNRDVVLAPLVFCRECGQEYYRIQIKKKNGKIEPRLPNDANGSEDENTGNGYLLIEGEAPIWEGKLEDLPETWKKDSTSSTHIKPEYLEFNPKPIFVGDDGSFSESPGVGLSQSWFLKAPFLICPSCGTVYDKRSGEFSKLATLSNEGRSTATTLLCTTTVTQMQRSDMVAKNAQKILSFTDNRQDASLQAGHFNDFMRTGLLRSSIYKALEQYGALDHSEIATRTVDALNLDQQYYAKSPGTLGLQPKRNKEALIAFIEYCIYADLRRGWRLVQPNLEQCGLLKIEYEGLEDLCNQDKHWKNILVACEHDAETRFKVCESLLNHLRYSLALDAEPLQADNQDALRKKVNAALKDPWRFDDDEILRESTRFVSGVAKQRGQMSLGPLSAIGKYLRSTDTWPNLDIKLGLETYTALRDGIVGLLREAGYLYQTHISDDGSVYEIKLPVNSMLWKVGDGTVGLYDLVRSKRKNAQGSRSPVRHVNKFFQEFYKTGAQWLAKMEAREHTGQTSREDRKDREERFRNGDLSCLFCSPTMELGIDIADLNSVNLRNVPPSPANYAQRSGRAGRSGQPAFITTYCSTGSGHDQYFFKRPQAMVSGVVVPPRLDLGNEELVKSHIHAAWLGQVGLDLGDSIDELLELSENGYPLKESVRLQIELSDTSFKTLRADCVAILENCKPDVEKSVWYNEDWLGSVLKAAPQRFNVSFGRWRELYHAAQKQIEESNRIIESGPKQKQGKSNTDQKEAEQKLDEAKAQRNILLNRSSHSDDTDFYPYRYLAAEGFLPGYNFPRLPVRAYFPMGTKKGVYLTRSRFLALTEYGPRNVVYHEGRKYRVTRNLLAPTDDKPPFIRAKMCNACGYFHTDTAVDVCENCETLLQGDYCQILTKLLEMSTVVTQRTESISCDEEERVRQGYATSSHFRFSKVDGKDSRLSAKVVDKNGFNLMTFTYGPSAELWRINRKWRRGLENGYTISVPSGFWRKRESEDNDRAVDGGKEQTESGVQVMVRDTRNVLMIKPGIEMRLGDDMLANLQHSLQKAICAVFQVDEDEIGSERIGAGQERSILMWEAAEGGVGILRKLVEEPDAIREVAFSALEICHFNPNTGDKVKDERECSHACYECLLTYRNQWDHALLDRNIVRPLLMQLLDSKAVMIYGSRSYEEQYKWLICQTDPKSVLEKKLLDYLYQNGFKLPDQAQKMIGDPACSADFFYDNNYVCVFCDGSVHDSPEARLKDQEVRETLANKGYQVVVIRYDRDLSEQVKDNASVFGGTQK